MLYDIGTGKTATFAIGILQRLNANLRQCQALILAPTRELAQQIVKVRFFYLYLFISLHLCLITR